jgi:hypothetical protein
MPVVLQIWRAVINKYLFLIGWVHCFMIVIGWYYTLQQQQS